MSGILTSSLENKKKYSKLLNNLLAIKTIDQTLFTRVNSVDSFDVTSKFSRNISSKILSQKQFSLSLSEIDLEEIMKQVSISMDPIEIINLYDHYKQKLSSTNRLLLMGSSTFETTKKALLENIKERKQKEKIRWKQFRRKILDSNIQDNVWPLHVATFFISIKTSTKELYGPLFLKEVELDVTEESIQIKSEDSWKINEKLLFMLNESGFSIKKEIFGQDDELDDLIKKFGNEININKISINWCDPFCNYKAGDIKNKHLELHPGVVLGMFKPSGGNLRKMMQEIIGKNEIDEILDPNPDKNFYKENVQDFILKKSSQLIRIQPSNFSQDRALISSLMQDTIIWGPPGTGKSQVIANIIANVLTKNQTAIVMSQKKAALDVLKKRLGKIAPFALFILNDNKMVKSEFYKPLQKFIYLIENNSNFEKSIAKEIISSDELKVLETIRQTNERNTYIPSLNFIEKLNSKHYILKYVWNLKNDYTYPKEILSEVQFHEAFMKLNNISHDKFLWIKTIPHHVKSLCHAPRKIIEYGMDPNEILQFTKLTNDKDVADLLNCYGICKNGKMHLSDDDYLVGLLCKRIINKIKSWRTTDLVKLSEYKKFANATRAERRIPFKFMNDHISIIKELFPIIITTPETNFINWEKNYFDYAILDESSQMFLEVGLPILYLAKIKILAGDSKQMQPSRWFTTRDDLDKDDEEDVVENADSLLDYAFNKGVYEVMLNKNYRSSSAALMSFSSKEFYASKLDVLDNCNKRNVNPIDVVNVKGEWIDGTNIVEVQKVINIVKKEIKNYNSIIILTFNSLQRQLIEKEILENSPILFKLMEEQKLAIRNIENIQGDEADLVVMSIVYDDKTNVASTYVARQGGKNALNVAISRAKEKMIVVKSVTAKTIKKANSEDFITFQKWLEFLDMSFDKQKNFSNKKSFAIEESFGENESNFECDVVNFITKNLSTTIPVKLIKQYSVGSYSIDIALLDSDNNFLLGIEVDGFKYHGAMGFEKYLEDFSRQSFLESKGYNIYRILEIDYRINKSKILNDITELISIKIN